MYRNPNGDPPPVNNTYGDYSLGWMPDDYTNIDNWSISLSKYEQMGGTWGAFEIEPPTGSHCKPKCRSCGILEK